MTEPDVALTDYVLAAESLLLLALLRRRSSPDGPRFWLALYFGSVSVAALCGGTVHGFFLDEQSIGHLILWPATLIAAGATALAAWAIGARILLRERAAHRVIIAAVAQFLIYSMLLLWTQDFRLAIVVNLPATLWLLAGFVVAYRRERHRSLLAAAASIALILIAALLQQIGVGVHPLYFSHNALYHVLQGVALVLFFRGARWITAAEKNNIPEPLAIPSGDHYVHTP